MNRRYVLGGLAAVCAGGAAFVTMTRRPGTTDLLPMAANAQEATGEPVEIQDMVLGNPDAPVEVIEYASFTCPHCRNFHATSFPRLKEDYIDTGKIRFVYREVFFDRYGLWAAMVARCGGEMRYFGIVDLLYEQQQEWTQGEPAQIAQNLRRIGLTAGLTNEQIDACMSDQAMAEALVQTYEQNAEADGIQATPSFVIDGTTYRNMAWEELAGIIDERVAAAG